MPRIHTRACLPHDRSDLMVISWITTPAEGVDNDHPSNGNYYGDISCGQSMNPSRATG